MQVNMHEAKTQLSKLVERVAAGEEVVIARAGKPVAKLVAVDATKGPRRLGMLRGQIWLADDWDSDEFNEELARDWYESEIFPPEEPG